jgi:hypothetical protein
VIVYLTAEDYMVATTKGAVRQLMAIKKKRVGSDHGLSSKRKMGQRLMDSIIGAMGEIAASRALNKPITSEFEDLKAVDIGGRYEARATEYLDGCLLVHKSSLDDAIYVLVVLRDLKADVCGWVYAREGKKEEYWREGDPGCYYVPQSVLHDLNEL